MRIEKLTLTNYRCFEHREIEFAPGFNVLIGENGAGKTTIIEALRTVLSHYLLGAAVLDATATTITDEQVREVAELQDETWVIARRHPARIKASGGFGPTNRRNPYGVVEWEEIETRQTRGIGHREGDLENCGHALASGLGTQNATPLPVVALYGCSGHGEAIDSSRFDFEATDRLDGYAGALGDRPDWQAMANWLARRRGAQLQARNGGPADLRAVESAVEQAMERHGVVEHDFVLQTLTARDRHDAPPVRFNNLSDGYRRVVGMVADIARRCAMLNPHLGIEAVSQTPGVVLIDEIDLHLHPKWQRTIVDSLKRAFPQIQFIATTHSPFIIQSLRPGELIRLDGPVGEYSDESIEDIAGHIQDVPGGGLSDRLERLYAMAKQYEAELAKGDQADPAEVARLRDELMLVTARASNDPAMVALRAELESQRLVAGVGDGA